MLCMGSLMFVSFLFLCKYFFFYRILDVFPNYTLLLVFYRNNICLVVYICSQLYFLIIPSCISYYLSDHFHSSWNITFRSSFSTSLLVVNSQFLFIWKWLYYISVFENKFEFSRTCKDEVCGARSLLGNSICEGKSGSRIGQKKMTCCAFSEEPFAKLVGSCGVNKDLQRVPCWANGQAFLAHLTIAGCRPPQIRPDLR